MSLRDTKKERTRQTIADAALSLFERQGFDPTTVDQIAENAGVSRRTFFRYFPSKEAVVFPDREQRLRRFEELMAARGRAEPPLQAAWRVFRRLATEYDADRERMLLRHRIAEQSHSVRVHDMEMDRAWERAIARTLGDLPDASETERRTARIQAGMMMGIVGAVVRSWCDARGGVALGDLADEAFEVLRSTARHTTVGTGRTP